MRALIHQLAPAQDQDVVGPANLAEAMRDQKGGPLPADAAHGPLNLVFGGAVDGAGAVVQNQDGRVG